MLVVGVVVAAAGGRVARAERLFVPAAGAPSSAAGIRRVQTLALDGAALASLRAKHRATLTAFPLGADGTAQLDVERFEPFAPGAYAEVVETTGPRALPLPERVYYRGTVDGDPTTRALVITTADGVRGMVVARGTIYRFGRDDTGTYRSWALRDADPSTLPASPLCGNDAHPAELASHPGRTGTTGDGATGDGTIGGDTAAAPPVAAFSPTLLLEVAIETDEELLEKFTGPTEALDYLADLAAAVSAIYDADTQVRVTFHSIRLWSTSDPWSATGTFGMLNQVQDYWNANETTTPRDVVHFVSGKTVTGGIAYLDVLCDPEWGYGVSTVFGSFDVMEPSDTWDVVVVAHELGHNFGSQHTHCYDPPVDMCNNDESTFEGPCYRGPTSVPPGGGTIMSYCHLLPGLPGGMANINLTFGATVSGVLRTGADNGVCIGLPCGDGFLDVDEECDDGNTTSGDCCSSTCTTEPDGGTCDDGEVCTTNDECSGGVCSGAPVADGSPCDDGTGCTSDSCQSGTCVSVPAPAAGCRTPLLPQRSQLVMKDKPTSTGDGVTWKWTKGEATTFGEFGSPATSDDYELCVFGGPSSAVVLRGRIPAGGACPFLPCWKTIAGKGYTYRDRERTPHGMEKLQLKAGLDGAAKIALKGKGALLDLPVLGSPALLPLRVQLLGPGTCWEATYSTAIVNSPLQLKAKSD